MRWVPSNIEPNLPVNSIAPILPTPFPLGEKGNGDEGETQNAAGDILRRAHVINSPRDYPPCGFLRQPELVITSIIIR